MKNPLLVEVELRLTNGTDMQVRTLAMATLIDTLTTTDGRVDGGGQ
jgi:hypothetical protein